MIGYVSDRVKTRGKISMVQRVSDPARGIRREETRLRAALRYWASLILDTLYHSELTSIRPTSGMQRPVVELNGLRATCRMQRSSGDAPHEAPPPMTAPLRSAFTYPRRYRLSQALLHPFATRTRKNQ
jgi:hypothetical protein